MSTQQPGRRAAGGWQRPVLAAVVTNLLTLGIGSALLVGATFGLAKAYAVLGLLWLGTIGLPTTLGVAGVAAVWGRVPLLSGMAGFCVVAALVGTCPAGSCLHSGLALAAVAGRADTLRRLGGGAWRLVSFCYRLRRRDFGLLNPDRQIRRSSLMLTRTCSATRVGRRATT